MSDQQPDFAVPIIFSKEKLEEGRAWQAELRLKYGTQRLEPAVKALQDAALAEHAVRQNIALQTRDGATADLQHSYARLAELLQIQGKFHEALEIIRLTTDQPRIDHAQSLVDAFEHPDEADHCDCKRDRNLPDQSHNYVARTYFVKGQWLSHVKCNQCRKGNIRQLRPGDLTEPTDEHLEQHAAYMTEHNPQPRNRPNG